MKCLFSGILVDRGRDSMHIEIHPQGTWISSFEEKNTQVGSSKAILISNYYFYYSGMTFKFFPIQYS